METPPKKPTSSQQFSPVILSESPVKSTPQKGNLTGNARVIRDLVADLYNLTQTWNKHHLEGYRIMKNIADLKVPALRNAQLHNTEAVYPEGLQTLSDELMKVSDLLDEDVAAMNEIAHRMDAVVSLEKLHNKDNTPLFLTWAVEKFGESCQEIYSAYNQELEVKQCIISEVSHCKSDQQLMMHLVGWVYQPFIVNTVERALESLLVETGHR